jgi:hypothetical protein
MKVDMPKPFDGTEQEAKANFSSHHFVNNDDPSCLNCDCKPWHITASYPCGVEPPRVVTTI